MFTKEDANYLRDSLPEMDFALEAKTSDLLTRYQNHYDIDLVKQGFASHFSIGTFLSDEFQVVCQYFRPAAQYQITRSQKGTAFLLHGYLDHTGIYGHLISHCLQQGLAVVIFDMPGHGLSSGKTASIKSFDQYVQAFTDCLKIADKQHLNQPWLLLGQSTGCAVIIDFLLGKGKSSNYHFKHIVLMAPLLRPRRWFLSQLLMMTAGWAKSSTRRHFSANSHDQEFLKFLKENDALQSQTLEIDWIKAMRKYYKRFEKQENCELPVDIIQGTDDNTVDWKYNLPRLEERFPQAITHLIPDAKHHMVNESPEYRKKIFEVVTEIVAE